MSLSLSADRVTKMLADLRAIQATDTISVLDLQKIVGVLMFACVVFSLCRPFLPAVSSAHAGRWCGGDKLRKYEGSLDCQMERAGATSARRDRWLGRYTRQSLRIEGHVM